MLAIVQKTGQYSKDATADGAGYVPAAQNDGGNRGYSCGNCALFRDGKCAIVKGPIEAGALCRFHVIDPTAVGEDDVQRREATRARSRAAGRSAPVPSTSLSSVVRTQNSIE